MGKMCLGFTQHYQRENILMSLLVERATSLRLQKPGASIHVRSPTHAPWAPPQL